MSDFPFKEGDRITVKSSFQHIGRDGVIVQVTDAILQVRDAILQVKGVILQVFDHILQINPCHFTSKGLHLQVWILFLRVRGSTSPSGRRILHVGGCFPAFGECPFTGMRCPAPEKGKYFTRQLHDVPCLSKVQLHTLAMHTF